MGIYVKAIRNFKTETNKKKELVGRAGKRKFADLMRKRQMDLKDQDKPLTFNLGDTYNINPIKGFITYESLGNIERR